MHGTAHFEVSWVPTCVGMTSSMCVGHVPAVRLFQPSRYGSRDKSKPGRSRAPPGSHSFIARCGAEQRITGFRAFAKAFPAAFDLPRTARPEWSGFTAGCHFEFGLSDWRRHHSIGCARQSKQSSLAPASKLGRTVLVSRLSDWAALRRFPLRGRAGQPETTRWQHFSRPPSHRVNPSLSCCWKMSIE